MARWQPSYFQTPDEKRMAAIRANPTNLPTRQVRPMLPNNYDATGGTNKWGAPNASIPQYLENNRKMYTMEDVPKPGGATGSPVSPNAPDGRPLTQVRTSNGWQTSNQQTSVDIARRYGGGAQAQNTAVYAQRGVWGAPDTTVGTGPSQGDVMDMERAGAVGPVAQSSKDAWQRKELKPALARLSAQPNAAQRWGGLTGELNRPMGQGPLDMTPEKRMAAANDSARQSYDYYARRDARRFGGGGQGRSNRSNMAF